MLSYNFTQTSTKLNKHV